MSSASLGATDYETVLPDGPLLTLPVMLHQRPSRSGPILLLGLAIPVALVSLTPFVLIAASATHDVTVLTRPGPMLAGVAALTTWLALFGWPLAVALQHAGRTRTIVLSEDRVVVTETGWFGTRTFRAPLSTYLGLGHRVRSSVSGPRHELVLVHPVPDNSILLRVAPRLTQMDVDDTARLLGCREIAPPHPYADARLWRWGRSGLSACRWMKRLAVDTAGASLVQRLLLKRPRWSGS